MSSSLLVTLVLAVAAPPTPLDGPEEAPSTAPEGQPTSDEDETAGEAPAPTEQAPRGETPDEEPSDAPLLPAEDGDPATTQEGGSGASPADGDDSPEVEETVGEKGEGDAETQTEDVAGQRGGAELAIAPAEGTPYWENAVSFGREAANGAVVVCETASAPLLFVPGVGPGIAFLASWLCVAPGALALDYVMAHHGDNPEGALVEAGLALALSKAFRDLTRYPVMIGLTAMAALVGAGLVGLGLVSILVLPASVLWVAVPAALAASSAVVGGLALGANAIRKTGSNWIFWNTLGLLGGIKEQDPQAARARADAEENAWLDPPHTLFTRWYAVAAVAAGTEVDFQWEHAIPFAGPIYAAADKATEMKAALERTGADVLHDSRRFDEMVATDAAIATLTTSEAILGAVAHAGLLTAAGGAALAVLGGPLVFAMPFVGIPLVVTAGAVGMVGGGGALLALLANFGVEALYPWVIPFTYGFSPDDPERRQTETIADDDERRLPPGRLEAALSPAAQRY